MTAALVYVQAHAGQARSYAQSTQVQAAHEPADYEQANYEEGSEHQEAPGRVQWVRHWKGAQPECVCSQMWKHYV